MKSSTLVWIVVALIIIAGIWWIFGGSSGSSSNFQYPTTQTSTTTTQATSSTVPTISSVTPTQGKVGTVVTIKGTHFDSSQNWVLFGNSTGRHHPDGSPDNARAKVASSDGTTLTFTIPTSGASGQLCTADNRCIAITATLYQPGDYPLSVENSAGTSNTLTFTITK